MTIEEKIGLVLKWLIAIVLFMVIVMPAQLIWFLILPFLKKVAKRQEEKTEVHVSINAMTPIELYGTLAAKFLGTR